MALTFDFHPDAEEEFIAAIEWYLSHASKAVADRFIEATTRSIRIILNSPLSHPVERGVIRKCHVKRFPYKILFEVDEDSILILAVSHAKRHPDYWHLRKLS